MVPAFVAEFLLFKRGEIRYGAVGAPVLGRFMPTVTIEVVNPKQKRQTIGLFQGRDAAIDVLKELLLWKHGISDI